MNLNVTNFHMFKVFQPFYPFCYFTDSFISIKFHCIIFEFLLAISGHFSIYQDFNNEA